MMDIADMILVPLTGPFAGQRLTVVEAVAVNEDRTGLLVCVDESGAHVVVSPEGARLGPCIAEIENPAERKAAWQVADLLPSSLAEVCDRLAGAGGKAVYAQWRAMFEAVHADPLMSEVFVVEKTTGPGFAGLRVRFR